MIVALRGFLHLPLRRCLQAGAAAMLALAGGLAAAADPGIEQQLESSMAAYAEGAIEQLASSQSPRERWIAGLMLADQSMRSDAAHADGLRERSQQLLDGALAAGRDDPTLLFWAILDPPLRDTSDGDALAQARLAMAARLQQLEPDNAVVWLGTLPPRDAPGAIPQAIEKLAKAASAKRFDTHFATSMRMLLDAYGRVPLPPDWPDTSALPGWQGVERADVAVIMAVGVASALAMPYLTATQWWCGGNADEQPWLDDCRKLAHTMVERSDSIVPRSLGLALVMQLYPPDSEEARSAQARRRELAWLVERGLQRVGPGQPVPFKVWREAWQARDATEFSVARALVRAQGLPAEPPADFVPAWDRPAAAPGD